MTFTSQDLLQLAESGISQEKVLSQIESFRKGFPFVHLVRPCIIGDGLTRIDSSQFDSFIERYDHAAAAGRLMKFVPASGAASRMFHALSYVYHHYDHCGDSLINEHAGLPDVKDCLDFIRNIERFAFYADIANVKDLIQSKKYDLILQFVLTEAGLNYTTLPKALIKFHRYPDHTRTALEEHLVEALSYVKDNRYTARVHFTISPEHRNACDALIHSVRNLYTSDQNKLDITFSEQKRSTDTIAVDMQNEPIRDQDGRLLFRPAGHGALLENLNELSGDIIFIKNIDNVVPDHLKEITYLYKKVLAGYLIQLQEQVFYYLQNISQNDLNEPETTNAFHFAQNKLSISFPANFNELHKVERIKILFDKLDRPIRVCGMVRNQDEPGGGPFWVQDRDDNLSLQIVEKTQIDMQSEGQKSILESATHFNPVDLVCGVRDYKGENFDLAQFADHETSLISIKSKDGKPIKAMELPGLWNGAMAHWITIFIEVPLITFNPVKTVNDLLRPEHQ